MKKLIILEGPDGGGKTTLAKYIVEALAAKKERYAVTDHGPYKGEAQIWKHYFDAMLPAYAGDSHVLMDRCWLAEPIYGNVMRGGVNRMEPWQIAILEHVAGSCSTTLVYCLPGLEACVQSFNRRRAQEYPENDKQITDIYYGYLDQAGGHCRFGRSVVYNYRTDSQREMVNALVE